MLIYWLLEAIGELRDSLSCRHPQRMSIKELYIEVIAPNMMCQEYII